MQPTTIERTAGQFSLTLQAVIAMTIFAVSISAQTATFARALEP
jgi:hypothetical protein